MITRAAKKIFQAGGSLKDVQALAGHRHLSTTQRYIEQDIEAQKLVVGMLYS
jgi:integrase/recombinase XerD